MKLNPIKTQEAWNLKTNGKYFAEKKAKEEKLKLEKQQEQERIALENKKKEEDNVTISKINELLDKKSYVDAANECTKLNFENPNLKERIQKILDKEFANEVVDLSETTISDYINFQMRVNKTKLLSIDYGKYEVKFDSFGYASNGDFPQLSEAFSPVKIPTKNVGPFSVKISSRAKINIELKDSILVLEKFSANSDKPIFMDKNQNFFYKTKTGLPLIKTEIDPSVEKNTVKISRAYKKEKYANGILLDSQQFFSFKTVLVNKKE
jgi:hypothetical protein